MRAWPKAEAHTLRHLKVPLQVIRSSLICCFGTMFRISLKKSWCECITGFDFGLFKVISLLSLLRIKGFPTESGSLIHLAKCYVEANDVRKPQMASDLL